MNKKGILGTIIGIIIFCIICNSSSNSFLKGCEFEDESDINSRYGSIGTSKTYYCKKNKLYDKVHIKYRDGSNYPSYSFVANNNIAAIYYRKDGEYYCSLYNIKDDIASCDEKKMLKLIKENIDKINDEVDTDRAKRKMQNEVSGFHNLSKDYMDEDYKNRENPNCEDLIKKNKYGITDTKGCQIKYENGVIVSLKEDGQAATIYDSENPKYYVNIKHNYSCKMQTLWGDCSYPTSTIEDMENRIPADYYIKNYNNAKQLSLEEVDKINPRLYAYYK